METLKASLFDWDKTNRIMEADISSLQLGGFPNQLLISSEKFASKLLFEKIDTISADGDIHCVQYAPVQTQSSISDIRIVIYND